MDPDARRQRVPELSHYQVRDGKAWEGGSRESRHRVPGGGFHDPRVQAAVPEVRVHVRGELDLSVSTKFFWRDCPRFASRISLFFQAGSACIRTAGQEKPPDSL